MKNLVPILMIIASIGLFYLHIDPKYAQVKSLSLQRDQYKEALKKTGELQVVRDELLTKYNSLPKDDLTRLERLLPANFNSVKFVADISAVAARYGISVKGVNVREGSADSSKEIVDPKNAKPYKTTIIALKFSASYPNLINFLRDVESSLELIDIKSVSFDTSGDASSIYNYDVILQTYWLE